ncbi:MAG: GerMN domain-containing protein [Syntrophobacterales bacterium]|jgi:hypothetical protein
MATPFTARHALSELICESAMGLSKRSNKRRRLWLLLLAAIALGFVAALTLAKLLSPTSEPISARPTLREPIPVQAATTPLKVHLYFANRSGRYLQAEETRLDVNDTPSAVEAIIAALLKGPENSQLVSPIPAGTQLRHLFVTDDGTAYLDFTAAISQAHPAGVTAERLTLYAIVNSLVMNLDAVERVQLLLEGKPASTLSGHLDIRYAKTANLLIVR